MSPPQLRKRFWRSGLGDEVGIIDFMGEGRPILENLARKTLPVLYPQEIIELKPGVLESIKDHENLGKGVIVLHSHMSREDAPHMMRLLREKLFPDNTREIVEPIASQTFKSLQPFAELIARAYGITLEPIVTKKTIAEGQGKSAIEGLRSYLKRAWEGLSKGGTVVAAIQADGNLSALGNPTNVLSALVGKEGRKPKVPDDVGVLFVGLVPKHSAESGINAHGVQIFRRMQITLSSFYTVGQARQEARDQGLSLDEWAFARMKEILPAWYSENKVT